MTVEQQRLIAMLDYLEEWDKLNRVPAFDVAAHQGLLAWQADIQELPGVHFNVADTSGEIWLEIERLRPKKPPDVTPQLAPWIIVKDDPTATPSHRETLPRKEDPDSPLRYDELPELQAQFEQYLASAWENWSRLEAPRRRSIALYDRLFNLLQTIETEGAETAVELVWGIGVAVWSFQGRRVRYPLISRLVEIDPITSDMSLRVRPREVPPILETDIYVELEIPGLPIFEKAARTILDHADSHVTPFDEASFEQVLAGAAGTLDRQARYWPREADYQKGQVPAPTETLTITDTWALFSRRKGTNFLINDIRRLREVVESQPIPDSAAKVLVETPEGAMPERDPRMWRGLSSAGYTGDESATTVAGELYFPKPFNAEQVQIIDRLEHANGVVVQGPPGTGKTHTIANVICHYLAEGKRVLVTSKGESALAVLRGHLPKAIQSLTVNLLTSEREGLKQLEQSISKITTEITGLNKTQLRSDIQQSRRDIDRLHERLAGIDRELADWARKNINPAPPALGGLKPAELAQHVVAAQKEFDWFPDELTDCLEHQPNFDSSAIDSVREARYQVGEDLIYLNKQLPEIASLPTTEQIRDLHGALLDLQSVQDEIDERKVPRIRSTLPQDVEASARLRDGLRDAARILRSLQTPWLGWLHDQFSRKEGEPVLTVLRQLWDDLSKIIDYRHNFLGVAITWEDQWDEDDDLLAAIDNAALGKAPFGLLSLRKKRSKERFQQIRFNGKPVQDVPAWTWVAGHANLRRQMRELACRWNSLTSEFPIPELPSVPTDAWPQCETLLQQFAEVYAWSADMRPSLLSQMNSVLPELATEGLLNDAGRLEQLSEAIDVRLRRHRLDAARRQSVQLKKVFSSNSLPAFKHAFCFVEEELGSARHDSQTVEKRWQQILDEFGRLASLQDDFATIDTVSATIAACGGKEWSRQLRTQPVGKDSRDLTPENWAAAWKWTRQCGYLRSIDGRERMQALSTQRANLQNDLGNAYARLVEQLTWLKLRETLDQDRGLMAALQQYMAAIRGIGKGTGIRAVRFRQDARRAMVKANKAIRCWVMPHWRVSESLPSELALFDLVIVDEASQSDLWALPALLRAKKLLIVGDNKQVSPTVFARESDIRQLHARFLRTLPFGDVLSPDKSVYDLGSVMFASDLVRLREHFRCVEPIIEFSNRLCYNGEIRCLRVPTAAERIVPPLVDVFVRGGYRTSRSTKVNRVEARAIIDEIKALTKDSTFAGRTIGVVSLLGREQAHFIFEQLISELGEEKIVQHQIRCGDAMTFQGREADIVFISMVSDAETVRALTGEMFEQRFNVAASRARDRMYLFRSFRREDLRESDLRATLLDHFTAPLRRDPEKKGRERCESDFERAVYDELTNRGFRVTPQVSAGGRRIDLVVEGHHGKRLAIECDGDQYHSPEVWMDDLRRQRALERAGWTFWRCWGSSFARDADDCITDLLRTLTEMSIEPIGTVDVDLTDVVEYREVGETQEDASRDGTEASAATADAENARNGNFTPDSAKTANPWQKPFQTELLNSASTLPLWQHVPEPVTVSTGATVGDSVRYRFVDEDEEAFVTLVPYESNPNLGMINVDTPVARALLGRGEGDECEVMLPTGKRSIRVIKVEKRSR